MRRVWESNHVRASIVRHEVAIVAMACMVSFLAALVSVPDNVLATNHGGWITQDETWDKTGNPHIIVRDVRITPSVTLTITEGVNVIFSLGTNLYIDGDLDVNGTDSEPVTFTSVAFVPQSGDWGSIQFNASVGGQPPSSQIDHAIVEYGSSAMYVTNRTLAIYNSTVRYNLVGIVSHNASLTLNWSTIHDNDYDGINWTGIFAYSSVINNNNITNNGGSGVNGSAGVSVMIISNNISFNKYGIHFVDSMPKTNQNDIRNNTEDGIYLLRSGNRSSVSNNTIANNSKNGIWVNMSWVLIDNNTIGQNGLNGTYLVNYNGTLENNTVLNNPGSGIYFVDSSGSFLQYNNVTLNGIHGVYSNNSSITLRENNITYNSLSAVCSGYYCEYGGVFVEHSITVQIDHNRIENNTVNGVFIRYVTQANVTDNAISDHFYRKPGAASNIMGIHAKDSRINAFRNSMVHNVFGVNIKYDQQPQQSSRIENNTIVGTSHDGIVLVDYGSTTMIANNSIRNASWGITSYDSSARIYNNHIQDITHQALYLSDWRIQGQSSNEDVFNNTISNYSMAIRHAVDNGESGSASIRNNTITGTARSVSGIYISGLGSATPVIKYNTITNHTSQDGITVELWNAHPQIINNTIVGNSIGVSVGGGANATIHGCNIYNNTYRGVYNLYNPGIIVNATENWWGHQDGPHDPSDADGDQNLNIQGQWITDWVRYRWSPYGLWWLTSPAQW